MKILAIDFGTKNLGLAISDGDLAEPLLGLKVKSEEQVLDKLVQICKDNNVNLIVIGLPEGNLVQKIKDFAQKLSSRLNLKIEFQDETLTSKEAKQNMVDTGKPRHLRKKEEHVTAACFILQDYLDQQSK